MTEFDNLRTLQAATTPGEWEGDATQIWSDSSEYGVDVVIAETFGATRSRANVAFIVAAHNELPALLARLDEVTAERDALTADWQALRSHEYTAIDFDGGTTFALTGENAGHWVEGSPTHVSISVLAAHDAKVRAETLDWAARMAENGEPGIAAFLRRTIEEENR